MASAAEPLISEPEEITATVVRRDVPDGTTREDEDAHKSDIRRIKEVLDKQDRVKIKLAEDTPVTINGHRLLIQGGVRVEVPQMVADILEDAGRI